MSYRKRFERFSEAPVVLMTQRRRLGAAFVAEQEGGAGAIRRGGVTVLALAPGPDGATARVGRD